MKDLFKGKGVIVSLAVEFLIKLIKMGYEYYKERKAERDERRRYRNKEKEEKKSSGKDEKEKAT